MVGSRGHRLLPRQAVAEQGHHGELQGQSQGQQGRHACEDCREFSDLQQKGKGKRHAC